MVAADVSAAVLVRTGPAATSVKKPSMKWAASDRVLACHLSDRDVVGGHHLDKCFRAPAGLAHVGQSKGPHDALDDGVDLSAWLEDRRGRPQTAPECAKEWASALPGRPP